MIYKHMKVILSIWGKRKLKPQWNYHIIPPNCQELNVSQYQESRTRAPLITPGGALKWWNHFRTPLLPSKAAYTTPEQFHTQLYAMKKLLCPCSKIYVQDCISKMETLAVIQQRRKWTNYSATCIQQTNLKTAMLSERRQIGTCTICFHYICSDR